MLRDMVWMIGPMQDNRDDTVGITVRRAFARDGRTFMWRGDAGASQIAAQLRAAADYLEEQGGVHE